MHTNLAGRAGRWSAAHWKTRSVRLDRVRRGRRRRRRRRRRASEMKSWAISNGHSRRAEQILDQATSRSPRARACSSSRARSTRRRPGVRSRGRERRPDARGSAGRRRTSSRRSTIRTPASISRDRHSALVQFDVKGKAEDAKDKIAPILAAVDERPGGQPELDHRGVRPGLRRPPARPALRSRHAPGRGHVAAADARDPRRRVRRARRGRPARAARVLGGARRDRAQRARRATSSRPTSRRSARSSS